jgi:hypothetical protein
VTLLDRLAAHGVKIPADVVNAVTMAAAAGQHQQTPLDGAAIIDAQHASGSLTPENLLERIVDAASREYLSSPRIAATWQLARRVKERAELDIASWYARSFDSIVEQLAPLFNEQAKIINELAGKALPENATPEQVLAGGRSALDAKHKVALAEVAALELWQLLGRSHKPQAIRSASRSSATPEPASSRPQNGSTSSQSLSVKA